MSSELPRRKSSWPAVALGVVCVLLASAGSSAPVAPFERYIAAAASAKGQGGTCWSTELTLFNSDEAKPVRVALSFLAADRDNRGTGEVVVEVAPRRGVTYLDLVGKLLDGKGAGAVRMRGDGPFLATSRTFTPGVGSVGTYGVSVPAVSRDQAFARGILLVRNEPGFRYRSNAGFVNPGDRGARVTCRVREAATGELLVERTLDLPPEGFTQVNDLLLPLGASRDSVAGIVVEFTATASADVCGCPAADCCRVPSPVFAFGTTIDNDSGDATFELGQPDPPGAPSPTSGRLPQQGTM